MITFCRYFYLNIFYKKLCFFNRYKHLPNGKALQDEDLRQTLEDVSLKLKNRSVQLTKLGSSQANENFNHMMASKAPKNRYKCM